MRPKYCELWYMLNLRYSSSCLLCVKYFWLIETDWRVFAWLWRSFCSFLRSFLIWLRSHFVTLLLNSVCFIFSGNQEAKEPTFMGPRSGKYNFYSQFTQWDFRFFQETAPKTSHQFHHHGYHHPSRFALSFYLQNQFKGRWFVGNPRGFAWNHGNVRGPPPQCPPPLK